MEAEVGWCQSRQQEGGVEYGRHVFDSSESDKKAKEGKLSVIRIKILTFLANG